MARRAASRFTGVASRQRLSTPGAQTPAAILPSLPPIDLQVGFVNVLVRVMNNARLFHKQVLNASGWSVIE